MGTIWRLQPEEFLPYYEALKTHKVGSSKLLAKALEIIKASEGLEEHASDDSPFAIDLGCGTGINTGELLRQGWRVLAIDYCRQGLEELLQLPEALQYKDTLETRLAAFSDVSLPKADLVAAIASLPYNPAETFCQVWDNAVASLVPGGYLVCNLFGPRHLEDMNHIVRRSREEIDKMLSSLQVLHIEEFYKLLEDDTGVHYFNIIARRSKSA